jgi:hypothetical protein
LQWRRRRLCMAMADARPPEGRRENVSRPPDRTRTATTCNVLQLTRPRLPGYFRCRGGRHLREFTYCRWYLFHDHGSSPQRWAATARFLRPAAVASDGTASWCCRKWLRSGACTPWSGHLMLRSWLAYVVVCSLRTSPSASPTQAARPASMRAKAGTLPRVGAGRSGQGWYSSLAQTSICENLPQTPGRCMCLALCGRGWRQLAVRACLHMH